MSGAATPSNMTCVPPRLLDTIPLDVRVRLAGVLGPMFEPKIVMISPGAMAPLCWVAALFKVVTAGGGIAGALTVNDTENNWVPLSYTRACHVPRRLAGKLEIDRLPPFEKQNVPAAANHEEPGSVDPSGASQLKLRRSLSVIVALKYKYTELSVVKNEVTTGGKAQPEAGGAWVVTL